MIKEAKLQPNLIKLFFRFLNHQIKYKKGFPSPFGTYYEFGVGWGGTLMSYFTALEKFCNEFKENSKDFRIYGFDSFEGLPSSKDPADKHRTWEKGEMAHSLEEIKQKLQSNEFSKKFENIKFVKGFYEQSLTSSLRDELSSTPPGIVTIDVDYYSSTKTVLEWLRPILKGGTFFYFDDIWAFHGNPNYGQVKAINEFNEKDEGFLIPFRQFGIPDKTFIYSNKIYEY